MALARAQACLLHSAVLLTNVAVPHAPNKHLRRACLELLAPILSGTAALLGPGPGAYVEAMVQSHHMLAFRVLVSALPRDRQHIENVLYACGDSGGEGPDSCPNQKEALQCLALWPPGLRTLLGSVQDTIVTLVFKSMLGVHLTFATQDWPGFLKG